MARLGRSGEGEPVNFDEVGSLRARSALRHVAASSSGPALDADVRVTLNFHPDRLVRGTPILRALAEDGTYHSQFVTGTSNGGLTAHPGGDRWRWESRIFGGAYDDASAHERPVYGALNFRHQVVGAAPRFGSSHFRLAGTALARATFCYPDSAAEPADFGVAAGMQLVALAEADERDALNDYIEAQIHGGVRLAGDVEAVVLDASYRGTPSRRRPGRCPARSSGIPATGSPCPNCAATRTTEARSTSTWAPGSRRTAASTHASSGTPHARDATNSRT